MENENIDNLDSVELIKLIIKEVKRNGEEIKRNGQKITCIENKLKEPEEKIDILECKTDDMDKKIDNLNKIGILEFEYIRNKLEIIDKEIDNKFSCLENKIENETKERKANISKIEGINDLDRIVLSEFGSRISILEEESQNYEVN